jgi:hypothetical protein
MLARISTVIVLIFAVTAGWLLLRAPSLPTTRTLHVQDEDWQLPSRARADVDALIQTIEQDKLWGGNGSPVVVEDKSLTPPNWRISGILSVGAEHYALLTVEDQPIQQIKTGENLPGGAKILNITTDRICILLNGKKRVLKTYKE